MAALVSPPSQAAATAHNARAVLISVRPNATQLATIAELLDAGTIAPPATQAVSLAQVRKAHEAVQAGRVRGKIVLTA